MGRRPVNRFGNARAAMAQRVGNLIGTEGAITFPAVPALADYYGDKCATVFATVGRRFSDDELARLKAILAKVLGEAYTFSQRSTVTVAYWSQPAGPLNYSVNVNAVTVGQAYEDWIANREGPLFGLEPDARVSNLAAEAVDPSTFRVLDIGAGTGRNALALARRGHPVDAAEPTPRFAETIRSEAQRDSLDVRVIDRDVFGPGVSLRSDYSMILLSGVVTEFRTAGQLRGLFELAAGHLTAGGYLVFNAFVAQTDYAPDEAARQFAEHSYSSFFTRSEIAAAVAGLPVEPVTDDSVHDYERAHLPDGAWPPTDWYFNWATGRDVFSFEVPDLPIELRWLVYRRVR